MVARLRAITIPKWGIEMERGTISAWRVALGESFAKGDELVDIETDKIVNSFEASEAGTLVRILAHEGEELAVGAPIGVMATAAVSDAEIDAFIASLASAGPAGATQATAVQQSVDVPGNKEQASRVSPALRRKAARLGLEIASIPGSGVKGRILRDDIENARALRAESSNVKPLSGAQKVIAERMVAAKQTIPHFHLHRDCGMDNALARLEQARLEQHKLTSPLSITINHLLLHAVAQALRKHPALNINVRTGNIETLTSIDVALAIDTGANLLTPVIRDIGDASLADIATAASMAVERSKAARLTAGDLQGGAITVSNLGMLGVTSFTAIINPPQVMILAVGCVQHRLILRDGQPASERICALTLACDHRVINGASGARFLADICHELETRQ